MKRRQLRFRIDDWGTLEVVDPGFDSWMSCRQLTQRFGLPKQTPCNRPAVISDSEKPPSGNTQPGAGWVLDRGPTASAPADLFFRIGRHLIRERAFLISRQRSLTGT